MATRQSTVDFILDQITDAGTVHARKMFGEYGIFCDGKMVALVCDDQLFVKPTAAGRQRLGEGVIERAPYPGAKPCFLVAGDRWEDRAWLADLLRASCAELPPPKSSRA